MDPPATVSETHVHIPVAAILTPITVLLCALVLRHDLRDSRAVLERIHSRLGRVSEYRQFQPRAKVPPPTPGETPERPPALEPRSAPEPPPPPIFSGTPEVCIPLALISEGVIDHLFQKFAAFEKIRPGCETLCNLLGGVAGSGANRKIVIRGWIDEGPEADCSPCHITPDREHGQTALELFQIDESRIAPMGVAHRHPARTDHCSEGDRATDVPWVRNSVTQEMVFCIATRWAGGHFGPVKAHERTRGEFKLSFYYLSTATGDGYFPARIETAPLRTLEVPPIFLRMAEADPVRTRLEFAPLLGLREYTRQLAELDLRDGRAGGVSLRHKVFGYTVVAIYTGPDPGLRRVLVEAGDEHLELPCDSGAPLVELVLRFEHDYTRQLGQREPAYAGSAHPPFYTTDPLTRLRLRH